MGLRYGIDIDGVLTNETDGWNYDSRTPNLKMIDKVNRMFNKGHYIMLFSARMKCDKAVTKEWLKRHGVKYNELILGKPKFDLYIDDIAITPEDFLK